MNDIGRVRANRGRRSFALTIMNTDEETRDEINSLASMILPPLMDRLRGDVDEIEGLIQRRPIPVTDVRARARDLADRVVRESRRRSGRLTEKRSL